MRSAWFLAACLALALLPSTVSAASDPNVQGIWQAYVPPSITQPNQTFVIHNNPGSTKITGTWASFKLSGKYSPSARTATMCAGCGQAGVTQTTDWKVTFHFKSTSTSSSNHPTFSGTYYYVSVATGKTSPGGKMRAVRCSYKTSSTAC